jgi:putative Mg2+ transporter-C (MgtC) family protein
MPLYPSWQDIALRLAMSMIAAALMGLDRGARGHAAGLRTTILVGLAAALAMIQANVLLPVSGKTPASFSVLDLMRLPLGILTGVGFIGGGAILKRGDIVRGVTTAATLWVTTVIGLCFGGGQLGLGVSGTGLALITLFVLDWLDRRMPRQYHARLIIEVKKGGDYNELPHAITPGKYAARLIKQSTADDPGRVQVSYEVTWRRREIDGLPLRLLTDVNARFDVVCFEILSEASH